MATRYTMGFVYVLRNPAMAGIVKIGRTMRLSEDRAKELAGTGVPLPFEVIMRVPSSRVKDLERVAHDHLAEYRVNARREFFETSEAIAIDAVLAAKAEVDGITAWSEEKPIRLRTGDRISLSLRKGQFFALLTYPSPMAASAEIADLWQAHSDSDTLELYATSDPALPAGLSDNDPEGHTDPVPYLNRDGSAANEPIIGRERLVPGDRLLWIDSNHGQVRSRAIFEASDWCQVVGRTREPQLGPEGWPLLLNIFTREHVTEWEKAVMHEALQLPPPRSWAPRHPAEFGETWGPVTRRASAPEDWLPQLSDRRRRRH